MNHNNVHVDGNKLAFYSGICTVPYKIYIVHVQKSYAFQNCFCIADQSVACHYEPSIVL